MKNIQDILKRRVGRDASGEKKELDEKTVGRVFFEAAKGEIKNLESEDIREMKLKEQILYIKTAHPAISSELFLRREKILEKANEIAGGKVIERVIIS
jgi:hypothetical protein